MIKHFCCHSISDTVIRGNGRKAMSMPLPATESWVLFKMLIPTRMKLILISRIAGVKIEIIIYVF